MKLHYLLQAILYHKRDHIVKFMMSVKEHDVQNRTPAETVTELPASMSKMESTLAWLVGLTYLNKSS